MPAVLAYISLLLQLLPPALEGVAAVTQGLQAVKRMVAEGRDPTPEEWAVINAAIEELQRKLHSDTA